MNIENDLFPDISLIDVVFQYELQFMFKHMITSSYAVELFNMAYNSNIVAVLKQDVLIGWMKI